MVNIAIFASGAGSNAEKIIQYFKGNKAINIGLIVCNKPGAGVLDIAANHGIDTLLIEKLRFSSPESYLAELKSHHINFIVLAGFLWKMPASIVEVYPQRIINIHPALLPNYGGKGMYGMRVHQAVLAAGEKESGITIHYVNEHYDEGNIIFQAKCTIEAGDTPEILAQKVHVLEHKYFPEVIGQLIMGN